MQVRHFPAVHAFPAVVTLCGPSFSGGSAKSAKPRLLWSVRPYVRQSVSLSDCNVGDLSSLLLQVEIGTPVTPAERNVHTNFGFSALFYLRVGSSYGTDGQTHGRARPVMRPITRAAY